MKMFLKLLLVIVVWTLLLAAFIGVSILLDAPIEVAIRMFLIVFLVWYGFKIVRFLFLRYRAKRRVEQLINVDNEGEHKRLAFASFLVPTNVEQHLKRLITSITGHNAGELQTDLGDLKWLMHIKIPGANGDWINESSAVRPQWKEPILSELDAGQWLVLNECFLLDVDVHVSQGSNETSKAQWFELLNGLSYCNKPIALDGLVFSVHLDQLLDAEGSAQIADHIREKVEEIKQHCGVDVAVTFMVEGMGELPAVGQWVDGLSDEMRAAPMGAVNTAHHHFSQLVTHTFSQLETQLEYASLRALVNQGFDASCARLPSKVSELASQLSAFGERCFNVNKFQKTPRVNGLFFTVTSRQHHCFVANLLEGQWLLNQPSKLLHIVTHADKQKRKKIGFAWGISALLIIIFGLIKQNDVTHVEGLFSEHKNSLVDEQTVLAKSQNLNQTYELLQGLSAISFAHWLPVGESGFELATLRHNLQKQMSVQVLAPLNARFSGEVAGFSGTNDQRIDYLNILIRRAQLLQAALSGADMDSLLGMPQPYDSYYLQEADPELLDSVNRLYLRMLMLQSAVDEAKARAAWQLSLNQTREDVAAILVSSDGNLQWLTEWVNDNSSSAQVELSDYWGEGVSGVVIPGAYTRVGKGIVDAVLAQISDVMGAEHPFIVRYVPEYQSQYAMNYQASWKAFMSQFSAGAEQLNSRESWLSVINNLPTGRNIYFKLLNDADYELSVLDADISPGSWLEFVFYYQEMLAQSGDEIQTNSKKNKVFTKLALKVIGAAGSVGKSVAKAGKSGLKTKAKVDKAGGGGPGASERELNLQAAADTLDAYKKGVADLVFNIEQKSESLSNMSGMYTNLDQPSAAESTLGAVQKQVDTLHSLIGKRGHSSEAFWSVFTGPVDLLVTFMRSEAGCELNKQWADNFLFQLYGVPDYKIPAVAYGDGGLLWQHIDTHLAGFLRKGLAGSYGLNKANGSAMPIQSNFVRYLTQAKDSMARQTFESVTLDVTMAPTSVNEQSMLYVSKTQLDMYCEAANQTLVNRNFIDTQVLTWEESCQRIELSFEMGNRTLVKTFSGRDGILEFLSAFNTGKLRYDVESFPKHFYLLKQYNVRYLDVNLSLGNADKLTKHLAYSPPLPPKTISQCWSAD